VTDAPPAMEFEHVDVEATLQAVRCKTTAHQASDPGDQYFGEIALKRPPGRCYLRRHSGRSRRRQHHGELPASQTQWPDRGMEQISCLAEFAAHFAGQAGFTELPIR